jgi:hypothetical protein
MRFFWNKKENQKHAKEDKKEDEISDIVIQGLKDSVKERQSLFDQMKSIYKPENDAKDSNIFYFLWQEPKLVIFSPEYLEDWENRHKVKLPKIIFRILTEIGSGKLINHHFHKGDGELFPLMVCLENDFLNKCIEAKIDPNYIEYDLRSDYNFETNQFSNPQVQAIYESLGSDRDSNLTVLFELGGHQSYLTLNRGNRKELAVFNVSGYSDKSFFVNGREYESPYYRYSGDRLSASILHNINTHYWEEMLESIKKMNQTSS